MGGRRREPFGSSTRPGRYRRRVGFGQELPGASQPGAGPRRDCDGGCQYPRSALRTDVARDALDKGFCGGPGAAGSVVGPQPGRALGSPAGRSTGGQGGKAGRRPGSVPELLDRVGVARAADRLHAYPHEFSGGMRQRVVIAMALMASPRLLVADEPTTALDFRTQRKVLDLILELCRERDMALVIISHDIDVIADMAERIVVLYAARRSSLVSPECAQAPCPPLHGGIVGIAGRPEGPVPERLASISGSPPGPGNLSGCCRFAPRCDFATERCRAEAPGLRNVALQGPLVPNGPEGAGGEHLAACHFSEMFLKGELIGMTSPEAVGPRAGAGPELGEGADLVVDVSALVKHYGRPSDRGGEVVALSNVSLSIRRGEALGVVGESGSGKSTLARCLAGLTAPTSGSLTVSGMSWQGRLSDRERRQLAKKVQLVFQDPYASLNPRMKVGDLVGEGLKVHGLEPSRSASSTRVKELLVRVGLDGELSDRSPRQLSGVSASVSRIASALAVQPEVLILDEPVSSLDLSVQAQVLNLVRALTESGDQTVLFISHDLGVVRFVCDRVVVLQDGSVVDGGQVDAVLANPQHRFTEELIASVPGRRRPEDASVALSSNELPVS